MVTVTTCAVKGYHRIAKKPRHEIKTKLFVEYANHKTVKNPKVLFV